MNILGINAYHGDASAALIQDGQVVAACEEERFNRIKHCAGFPKLAIRACLKEAGLSLSDIDAVGISRDPKANLSSKVLYAIRHGNHLSKFIGSRISNAAKIFNVQDKIEQALDAKGALKAKVYAVEHHLAHMASGFFASPFESSAVMSIDGFGDFVSTKWGKAEGNQINILGQVQFPHSLGILYTAVTQYLGFPNYGDEYKVMGLAALGEAVFSGEFGDMIQCGSNNSSNGFKLNLDYFTHHRDGIEMNWEKGYPNLSACFSKKMTEKFGPARNSKEPITGHHKNIAASLQKTYENIFFHLLNSLQRQTGSQNLCLAGGCALNAVANGKIRAHTGFQNVFVQPAAGDAGTALGAALYVQHVLHQKQKTYQMTHVYLGPGFDREQIKAALDERTLSYSELSEDRLVLRTAEAVRDGKIVGWFQDRMEFGPRALGNRSLLADPRKREMKDILNRRIKHREDFRPFAPSILEEETNNYFESSEPVPFMTEIFKIKKEKQTLIPAVTHVDGTGRLQTVSRLTNPKYWSLIRSFADLTGVPVVLNTSFNENEPIVCTPQDAVNCFTKADVDCLAIGNFWVERSQEKR